MTATSKKRIQVASFSVSDISRGDLVSFVAGFALILCSAVFAVASNSNARATADSKGAARILVGQATNAEKGIQNFVTGGSERIGTAVANVNTLNAAFADVLASANSALVLSDVKKPAAEAYGAWNGLSGALSSIALPASLASELSDATGRFSPQLASLLKKLEATGRQSSTWSKSHEAALRLYSYAEGGFGMASVPRVEYDLQVLLSELGQSELRGDVAFAEQLLAVAKTAGAKKVSREQLNATFEAALVAKAAAEALGSAAVKSQSALWLGFGAVGLAVLGLAAVVMGLRGAVAEFSKRYARSMQQFRSNEQAHAELMVGLRAAAEGDIGASIQVTGASPEVASIAYTVNQLLEMVRDRVSEASTAIRGGVSSGDLALAVVESASTAGDKVALKLTGAVESLSGFASRTKALSLDSRSLQQAAAEAASRSADATRAAQDAASRLESMREGLQDTSKRVKRLGERSQEINSVVDAMELMAEQIGVLALNASLEAERAGEAGSGFRLVAREVQALAHRSEEALVRISGLVQGVQADARTAAESVERSTGQLVAGANVGAVSQALLNVMAPLAESIGAMATGLEAAAHSSVADAEESVREANVMARMLSDMVSNVRELKVPVGDSRRSMSKGLNALSEMQANVEAA